MTKKEKEFRSKVEDFVGNVKELRFPSSAGFRPFHHFFSEEAVSHPAKANLYMLHYLIKKYTEKGEVVADILAGTGSTGIVASYLGRHAVLVELEEKFVEWMKKNAELLEKRGRKKGEIKIIQGDARKLTDLLCVKADAIVTSPPYADAKKGTANEEDMAERWDKAFKETGEKWNSWGKTWKTEGRKRALKSLGSGYSESEKNIGNLPLGKVNVVITSPPYGNQEVGKGIRPNRWEKIKDGEGFKGRKEWRTGTPSRYSDSNENIGNLPLGEVDAVITSPPYADSRKQPSKIDLEKEVSSMETDTRPDTKNRHTPGREKAIKSMLSGYSESKENIGNLPHGDVNAIITSPPYSESKTETDGEKGRRGGDSRARVKKDYVDVSEENIGSLPHGEIDAVITSPPYSETVKRDVRGSLASRKVLDGKIKVGCVNIGEGYSQSQDNIGNLPHGDVDAIITSPPYSSGGWKADENPGNPVRREVERKKMFPVRPPDPGRYSESKENIGNLPHGEIDAIVTSPPYSESMTKKRKGHTIYPGLEKTREMPQETRDDNIANLYHGDINAVITSPPYADGFRSNPQDRERRLQKLIEVDKQGVAKGQKWATTSKEALKRRLAAQDDGYGRDPNNIGNLAHGNIDAVITSPPYAQTTSTLRDGRTERISKKVYSNICKEIQEGYSGSKENIGNLEYKEVDAVITSPPYEGSVSDDKEGPLVGADEKKYGRWRKGTAKKQSYTQHEEPCKVDAIITSPPYEGSLEGTTRHTRGGIASRDPALAQTGSYATVMSFGVPVGYSPNKNNIGNLKSEDEEYKVLVDSIITSPPYHDNKSDWDVKSKAVKEGESVTYSDEKGKERENIGNIHYYNHGEPLSHKYAPAKKGSETYLQAMFNVYQECYQVLKRGGRIIIIVKPFVRNKKAVDLPFHTWLLLEKCGFNLVDVLKFRLPTQSFWRVLQYQKYPEIERINHEYIIVAQKPEFFR